MYRQSHGPYENRMRNVSLQLVKIVKIKLHELVASMC